MTVSKKSIPFKQPLPRMVPDEKLKGIHSSYLNNSEVKDMMGNAELLVKNCVQQGATLIHQLRQNTSFKTARTLKIISSPFQCTACLTSKCTTDLAVYKKCKEECSKTFRSKCMATVEENNLPVLQAYHEHYNNKQFN